MTTYLYPQGPPKRFACPHCGAGNLSAHRLHDHLRDTGAQTELPPGRCPELFIKRNRPRPDAFPANVEAIHYRCAS